MQNVKLLLGTLLGTFVVIIGLGMFLSQGGSSGEQIIDNTVALIPENANSKGASAESAAYTLVEFSDFQCPACRSQETLVEALVAEYENLRVVYRHFPLNGLHEHAQEAAWASEAAAKQGKFWEMHDELFARQDVWSDSKDVREDFTAMATDIGLDVDQFLNDYASDEVRMRVSDDLRMAEQLGINATPTFFLNNKKVSLNQINSLIE